ncbi:uncharacterized protein EDB91DRAFT_1088075 [Suillus paluster]|uniref:uncharacterized protein n=1 Tax=Suillus paluster TaxID=48578 RepID=UPI001B879198|nr:uncharacterized protein EDB91DRAFT_1088075 [Suillus paluster]KAG1722591.1 hypothetical protein EDB91DRAFT_1088075 [Suillus paluster]
MDYESPGHLGYFLPPTLLVVCQSLLYKEHISSNFSALNKVCALVYSIAIREMSSSSPETPDSNSEQFGGSHYVSPPATLTPSWLRLYIKPTVHNSGLVKNVQDRRAKLLTDHLDESGEVMPPDQNLMSNTVQPETGQWLTPISQQELPNNSAQGPCEPPLPLIPQQPQPNMILPQPPIATMQGTCTPVGLNGRQDVHAAPLNIGLSVDAPGMLGLSWATPMDVFGQGTAATFNDVHCPFTDTTFNFSLLDIPWDPPSFSAQPVEGAFLSNGDEGESPASALVDCRTDEVNVSLEENFKAINDIFNDLVTKTGLPLQQVSHELQRLGDIEIADGAQITPTIRAECYKVFQVPFLDSWQEILEMFEQMEMRSIGPQTVSQQTQKFGVPSTKEDEPPHKHKSSKVLPEAPAAMKDDLDAPEVLDINDWQLQVDLLQSIKGGIIALLNELGGKLTVCSGNFPWKKLCSDLDHQGFVIEGYLEDILMPGETCSTNARSKGIDNLNKQEQIIFAEALKSGTLLLANSIMDHEGPSHLQPSAATTKVRKPTSRQATPIALPIVVKDDSPTSAIVHRKNLVVSVEIPPAHKATAVPSNDIIPPAHPFKVVRPPKSKAIAVPSNVITLNESVKALSGSEGDDSEYDDLPQDGSDYEDGVQFRKCKAKTIGSTDRFKCHVPSSDIEVIELEPRPKGKGKEAASQKERARVCYHELTSDSEEEQKPDKVKEGIWRAFVTLRWSRCFICTNHQEQQDPWEHQNHWEQKQRWLRVGCFMCTNHREQQNHLEQQEEEYHQSHLTTYRLPPHLPSHLHCLNFSNLHTHWFHHHSPSTALPSKPHHINTIMAEPFQCLHMVNILTCCKINYQWTVQPLQVTNQGSGVDTASYSHAQYAPRNNVYPHLVPHHANTAHAEAYNTNAPAHQQCLEDYNTCPPVPFQQQQYPEIYGCVPASAPSEQQQHMENYGAHAPAPQQYKETYNMCVPVHQPPASQQHTETYNTCVPAPQQGLVGHHDGMVAYNMDEHWQPHYGSMVHQAENIQTPPL